MTILNYVMPLLGVLIGAGATLSVQRATTRDSRMRFITESKQAHRTEVKSAIASYLEAVQQLQSRLDAREHGEDAADLRSTAEQVLLAYKQTAVICSAQLQPSLLEHTRALHLAVREMADSDWWAYVEPFQARLLDSMRLELSPAHEWYEHDRHLPTKPTQ